MDYIEGKTLFNKLKERKEVVVEKGYCLEECEARNLFEQLARTLAFAHNCGFAHKDLKTDNIMVTNNGELKVIDWGLSEHLLDSSGNKQLSNNPPSSLFAASPESFRCYIMKNHLKRLSEDDAFQTDVWCLGMVLFQMLYGKDFIQEDKRKALVVNIVHGTETGQELNFTQQDGGCFTAANDLLQGMLQQNPDQRMTMSEVLAHEWLQVQPTK